MRFGFIEAEKARYPVAKLCTVLEVSRQGFYAWRKRGPSRRAQEDARLSTAVRMAYIESHRRYGAPRVHKELEDKGETTSKKRVARLMQQQGLRARAKRKFVRTTQSQHSEPVAPNLVQRDFHVDAPNRVWVADITYLPTEQGWLYLAVIIDLFSRKVVGWSAQPYIDARLVLGALSMAILTRRPPPGLVLHTDRGIQYACKGYREALRAAALVASMSRKGDCWDNAVAESFFSTLEFEGPTTSTWRHLTDAEPEIFMFIEGYYNQTRLHSHNGYRSPNRVEADLRNGAVAA